MILEKAYFFHRNLHISHIHQKFIQLANESIEYKIVIRNSKNIFLFIRNFDRLFKKGNKFVFLFIRKGYKVFSPLLYENDLFIRGKRIQYNYLT